MISVLIDVQLPEFVDEPENTINPEFQCDLVLYFLKHADLSYYLQNLYEQKQIPIISPGKSGYGPPLLLVAALANTHNLASMGTVWNTGIQSPVKLRQDS